MTPHIFPITKFANTVNNGVLPMDIWQNIGEFCFSHENIACLNKDFEILANNAVCLATGQEVLHRFLDVAQKMYVSNGVLIVKHKYLFSKLWAWKLLYILPFTIIEKTKNIIKLTFENYEFKEPNINESKIFSLINYCLVLSVDNGLFKCTPLIPDKLNNGTIMLNNCRKACVYENKIIANICNIIDFCNKCVLNIYNLNRTLKKCLLSYILFANMYVKRITKYNAMKNVATNLLKKETPTIETLSDEKPNENIMEVFTKLNVIIEIVKVNLTKLVTMTAKVINAKIGFYKYYEFYKMFTTFIRNTEDEWIYLVVGSYFPLVLFNSLYNFPCHFKVICEKLLKHENKLHDNYVKALTDIANSEEFIFIKNPNMFLKICRKLNIYVNFTFINSICCGDIIKFVRLLDENELTYLPVLVDFKKSRHYGYKKIMHLYTKEQDVFNYILPFVKVKASIEEYEDLRNIGIKKSNIFKTDIGENDPAPKRRKLK